MLNFDTEKKVKLNGRVSLGEIFSWLPHDDDIIMVKEVLSVSADWGVVEIDRDKIIKEKCFRDGENLPVEYSIELIAQGLGMIGAAQSIEGIVERSEAEEAYVTGLKNFIFYKDKISTKAPLFVEIKEFRNIEGFRFCNTRLYTEDEEDEEGGKDVITEGVLKTFSVDKKNLVR